MTALPQGVTLARQPYSIYHTVTIGPRTIGWVWDAGEDPGAWHAIPDAARHGVRRFTTREAAARWVCLQARPVVYRVRLCRDPGHTDWAILAPDGARIAAREDHAQALQFADRLARRVAAA